MVELLEIIVVTVFSFAFPMLWYSPGVVGKTWMKLSNISEKDTKSMPGWVMPVAFLLTLIYVAVLAWVIDLSGVSTFLGGVFASLLVWIGFIASQGLQPVLWKKQSMKLFWIDHFSTLIVTVVGGGLLAIL